MLAKLTALDFQEYQGKELDFHLNEEETISLQLVEIEEKPEALPVVKPNSRIPFSLLFTGCLGHSFTSGVGNLVHPTLGLLESVFLNRIIPPTLDVGPVQWYEMVIA